jgi:hypothetical protein
MCPVRFVTYVSGRSQGFFGSASSREHFDSHIDSHRMQSRAHGSKQSDVASGKVGESPESSILNLERRQGRCDRRAGVKFSIRAVSAVSQ